MEVIRLLCMYFVFYIQVYRPSYPPTPAPSISQGKEIAKAGAHKL